MGNSSSYPLISSGVLGDFEIPIPELVETIKLYLDYLNPANESLQSQKEREICGLIKMLTSFGKNGVNWDEYELKDVCKFVDGYDFYRNEMDNDKIYKPNINLPLLKINDNTISDYVILNEKYKKYIVKKGDFVIGTKGSCGKIRSVDVELAYHKHGLLKIVNMTIDKKYLYYYIKLKFDDEFIKLNTNESVLSNMKKDNIEKTKIRILKPEIMMKYKLQEEFDFMEKLRNDICQTLKNQEDITKQMMSLVLGGDSEQNTNKENNDEQENSDNQTDQSTKSINTTKSTKSNESVKILVKGRNTKNIKNVEIDDEIDELEKALSN